MYVYKHIISILFQKSVLWLEQKTPIIRSSGIHSNELKRLGLEAAVKSWLYNYPIYTPSTANKDTFTLNC
jgi:hypothetical protein